MRKLKKADDIAIKLVYTKVVTRALLPVAVCPSAC